MVRAIWVAAFLGLPVFAFSLPPRARPRARSICVGNSAFASTFAAGRKREDASLRSLSPSSRSSPASATARAELIRLRGGFDTSSSNNGGSSSSFEKQTTGAGLRAAGLHILEFGIPPALFLFFAFRVITDPASPIELVTFVTAASAAIAAESVTFPMDALKARMQLKNAQSVDNAVTAAAPNFSPFENIGLLYYGLRAALCRTIPYTGMRMTLYGFIKTVGGGGDFSPLHLAFMATIAGIVSQLLISPMDLFKIRMQGDAARVRRGEEAVYSSLFQLIYRVARLEGIQGLWTGCKINAIRAAFMNIADQAVTDVVRGALGPGAWSQLVVSAVTGVSVVCLTCPADTVRSKLMNNGPSSPQPKYKGIMDTMRRTWSESGVRGFYAAVVPMYLREGPYYFILWNALGALRHLRDISVL